MVPNPVHEEKCIALMLCYPKQCVELAGVMLNPEYFADKLWQKVFTETLLCYGEHSDADLPTVIHRMQKSKTITSEETAAVARAAAASGSPNLIGHWAREVLSDALRRELATIASIPDDAKVEETIAAAQDKLNKIQARLSPLQHAVTEGDFLGATEAYLRSLHQDEQHSRIPLAFPELANRIGGALPLGTVVTVGGLTSNGKTLFLLQSLIAAAKAGHNCVLISQEMGFSAMGERLAAMACKHDPTHIEFAEAFAMAKEFFGLEGDLIYRQVANTGDAVAAEITRCRKAFNATVFAIDYLQLLVGGNTKTSYERVTYNSSVIRAATTNNNVTTYLAAQLNRSVMGHDPPIPHKHHFRDSGQIEQDADVVLMLRHPEKDTDRERIETFIEQKNYDCRAGEYFEIYVEKLRARDSKHLGLLPAKLCANPLRLEAMSISGQTETVMTGEW